MIAEHVDIAAVAAVVADADDCCWAQPSADGGSKAVAVAAAGRVEQQRLELLV